MRQAPLINPYKPPAAASSRRRPVHDQEVRLFQGAAMTVSNSAELKDGNAPSTVAL